MQVGTVLKRLREGRGLSQNRVAELSGLSPAAISKIEGGTEPRLSTAVSIVKAITGASQDGSALMTLAAAIDHVQGAEPASENEARAYVDRYLDSTPVTRGELEALVSRMLESGNHQVFIDRMAEAVLEQVRLEREEEREDDAAKPGRGTSPEEAE